MTSNYMKRYLTSFINVEMQSQATVRYAFILSSMTKIIDVLKQKISSVGKGVEKHQNPQILGGNTNSTAIEENNVMVVSQLAKNRVTRIAFLGIVQNELKMPEQKVVCEHSIFIVAQSGSNLYIQKQVNE